MLKYGVSSSLQCVSRSALCDLEGWDNMDMSSFSYSHNSQQHRMGREVFSHALEPAPMHALHHVAKTSPWDVDRQWEGFTITPLLDFAANRPGMTYEQVLRDDVSSHVLDNLQEDREYSISIYAVYPQGPSQPVAAVGRTCKRFDFVAAPFLPWVQCSHPLLLISTSQLQHYGLRKPQ